MKISLPSTGFHLVEILITLAMISLLSAIAIPNYTHYITQAHRLAAANALCKLAVQLEHFHIEHHTYQGLPADLLNTEVKEYRLHIQSATEQTYQLIAIPLAQHAMRDRHCGSLTLNSIGEKGVTGQAPTQHCW